MPGLVFDFYPRSPCGERHVPSGAGSTTWKFLSTLSLRRATVHFDPQARRALISIHALLAESDDNLKRNIMQMAISIHALLAESDGRHSARCQAMQEFLSTLSLRRATMTEGSICLDSRISIHALLAESDMCHIIDRVRACISIHALLAESDRRGAVPVILII